MKTDRTGLRLAMFAMVMALGCIEVPVDSGGGYGRTSGYPSYPPPEPAYDERRSWEQEGYAREAQCRQLRDRIDFDRAKLAAGDPTKNPDARQWFRNDIANAERELEGCHGFRREQRDQADFEREQREHDQRARVDAQRQQCRRMREKIDQDRAKLAQGDPNKNPQARQWFRDDIANNERQIAANCRGL